MPALTPIRKLQGAQYSSVYYDLGPSIKFPFTPKKPQREKASSTQSLYERLVKNEIQNPMVRHSFEPNMNVFNSEKFGKENNSNSSNLAIKTPKRKVKVIIKQSLFPMTVNDRKTSNKEAII